MVDKQPSLLSGLSFDNITQAHCHVLEALHKTSFDRPWSATEFEQLMDNSATHGLIALNAQTIPLGFILLRNVVDEAEILTFCVDPQYRTRKIATRILAEVMTIYKGRGNKKLFLEVAEENRPAIGLYQKCGFNVVGERPDYYRKPGNTSRNAIIMACNT